MCDAEVTDSNTTCAAVVDLSSTNVYASVVRNVDHNNNLRSMTYSKPTYGLSHNKVSCSASIQTGSSQSQQMDAFTSQVSVPRLTVCQPDNNQVSTPRRNPPGSCITTNQNDNATPTSPAESDHTDNCSWPKFMQCIGYPHIEPPPEGHDQNNQTTLEINGTLNLTMDSDTYNDPAAPDFSKWPFPAKELPHTLANIYDQVKTYGCHN